MPTCATSASESLTEWASLFSKSLASELLGSIFGGADFSRIFIFEPPDFFADFVTRFFSSCLWGKSAQKNPPGKSPAKSAKIYATKIPDISAEGLGQELLLGIRIPCSGVFEVPYFECLLSDFPLLNFHLVQRNPKSDNPLKNGLRLHPENRKRIAPKTGQLLKNNILGALSSFGLFFSNLFYLLLFLYHSATNDDLSI